LAQLHEAISHIRVLGEHSEHEKILQKYVWISNA